MSALPAAILRTTDDAIVPLQSVAVSGRLEGLLFELTVEQHYRNTSDLTLETVFTFPIPLHAVLLGLELDLNGKRHTATAIARQQAEERYEKAIDCGDSAALLSADGNGLYTVSLGNFQAGDTAVLRYRYAELLHAHADYVRLNIPTVVAPRYGDPAAAGLEGPAIPGSSLLAEYPLDLTLDLIGLDDAGAVRSPSHTIRTEVMERGIKVRFERRGYLDRDVVIELERARLPNEVLIARDGEGVVALASTALPRNASERRALNLKLLLDCSGSMQGSSIDAARRALTSVLDRLTEHDTLSLTRFGGTVEHVSSGMAVADAHSVVPLKALVRRIDADLGGTEMARALRQVIRIPVTHEGPVDLLLITDGEIHDLDSVLDVAAQARHRLFVIAIGAAPNEALARSLAQRTGGACEFVATDADAEEAILRMFHRLRATPRTLDGIDWTATPAWTTPQPGAVFPGDTLHCFAGFAARPAGPVTIAIGNANGTQRSPTLPVAQRYTEGDVLPRLAAARRLATLGEAQATALAVQYQIVSPHTSFVLVAERDLKANELPTTIAVPQMLAAGWGGTGVVCQTINDVVHGPSGVAMSVAPPAAPAKRSIAASRPSRPAPELLAEAMVVLDAVAVAHAAGARIPATLAELCAAAPVPASLRIRLEQLIATARGTDEPEIIRVFLAMLAREAPGTLSAALRKALKGKLLASVRYRALRRRIDVDVLGA